jgi:hypothetical protein
MDTEIIIFFLSILPVDHHLLHDSAERNPAIFLRFQVVLWINQNFLLLEEIEAVNGQLDVAFQSLRTHTPLVIRMQQNGNVCDFAVSVLNRSS